MLKIYLLIIVLGLAGGVGYGGWYYYKDTQERIRILTENTVKLETAKKMQDATINAMIVFRRLTKSWDGNSTKPTSTRTC